MYNPTPSAVDYLYNRRYGFSCAAIILAEIAIHHLDESTIRYFGEKKAKTIENFLRIIAYQGITELISRAKNSKSDSQTFAKCLVLALCEAVDYFYNNNVRFKKIANKIGLGGFAKTLTVQNLVSAGVLYYIMDKIV